MTSTTQRVQQGIRALLAFATPVDLDLAQQYLSSEEFSVFLKMARAEQLHSLNVLRDVLAESDNIPNALAVAALLHDVGKSRYHLAVWQKTTSVLVKAFLPSLAQRIASGATVRFWNAPFIVRAKHPRWSADILRDCGSDEVAIWLAEHHQEPSEQHQVHPYYDLLCRLQTADDAN